MVNELSIRFSCVVDCAEALSVDSSAILARIKNGWPGYFYEDEGQQPVIDNHRGFYRKTVHTPHGIFESLAEAGRQLNISYKQIHVGAGKVIIMLMKDNVSAVVMKSQSK